MSVRRSERLEGLASWWAAAWIACVAGCGSTPSGLVDVAHEAPGDHCQSGGLAVSTGIDADGDGVLDPGEIDETEYVCNGDGAGATVLIREDVLDPGPTCAAGGISISSGLDDDGDGALSTAEIDSVASVCNGEAGAPGTMGTMGTMGTDGADGVSSVLRLDPEPPGTNCASGGTAVHAGVDADGDATLDDEEIATTSYVCDTRITTPHPRIVTAEGTTGTCHAASGSTYTTIPDMNLELDLDADYVVLTLLDMTINPSTGGAWAGVRFAVDGVAETQWTHVQPDTAGEDQHLSLFRIDTLAAGEHTILAQWGDGAGTVCNNADDELAVWMRRITALAIPVSSGVTGEMVSGTTNASHAASGTTWTTIPSMTVPITLASDAIVLSELDINLAGTTGSAWAGLRLAVDGAAFAGTHVQPSSASEDEHVHLFGISSLPAGTHTLEAQWGEGSGTLQNTPETAGYFTRRLGYVAIPLSTGVVGHHVSPASNQCRTTGDFTTMPGLALDLDLAYDVSHVTLTQMAMNTYSTTAGGWTAIRTLVDATPDPRSAHAHPSATSEDEHLHLHRAQILGPGPHRIEGQWGLGGGTMCQNPSDPRDAWTRQLGTIAIPLRGY